LNERQNAITTKLASVLPAVDVFSRPIGEGDGRERERKRGRVAGGAVCEQSVCV